MNCPRQPESKSEIAEGIVGKADEICCYCANFLHDELAGHSLFRTRLRDVDDYVWSSGLFGMLGWLICGGGITQRKLLHSACWRRVRWSNRDVVTQRRCRVRLI